MGAAWDGPSWNGSSGNGTSGNGATRNGASGDDATWNATSHGTPWNDVPTAHVITWEKTIFLLKSDNMTIPRSVSKYWIDLETNTLLPAEPSNRKTSAGPRAESAGHCGTTPHCQIFSLQTTSSRSKYCKIVIVKPRFVYSSLFSIGQQIRHCFSQHNVCI